MRSGGCGPGWRQLWELPEDGAVELLNTLLREANALPQLVKHDNWDYHLHATAPEAPLADRMAVEAAMAFTDVIRTKQLDRLRRCAAADCEQRARGPVQEPVPPVLRHGLREPDQRGRLPHPARRPALPAHPARSRTPAAIVIMSLVRI